MKRSLDDDYSGKLSHASAVVIAISSLRLTERASPLILGFNPLPGERWRRPRGPREEGQADHERGRAFAESTSRHATAEGATDGFLDAGPTN